MTSDRKSQLLQIIEKNPGFNFRDLMRATGMKNGVLSHHLHKMEQAGSITVIRSPRQSRFYLPHIQDGESRAICALRRSTPRRIIESLLLDSFLTFRDIVQHTGKAPSTVSSCLSTLVADGIVGIKHEHATKRYHLDNRAMMCRLIGDYRPGMLDGPVSGLEDIINRL